MGAYLFHCRSPKLCLTNDCNNQSTIPQLGGVTCLWAFVIYFILPDAPSNARFFNARQRLVAVKRVAGNETGIKNKKYVKEQALVAFKDPKMILLFISVFAA